MSVLMCELFPSIKDCIACVAAWKAGPNSEPDPEEPPVRTVPSQACKGIISCSRPPVPSESPIWL